MKLFTEKTKRKMSLARIGKHYPLLSLAKKGLPSPFKGKHHTEETKKILSLHHIGKHYLNGIPKTEEHKRHLSESKKRLFLEGKLRTCKGIKRPWLTKRNLINNPMKNLSSELNPSKRPEVIAKLSGANCHLWKGGIARLPYSYDFNKQLKSQIKQRDNLKCQICGIKQDNHLHIHHIDYDKKNVESNNLITLCQPCHSKTNINRNWWLLKFVNKGRI